MQVIEDIFSVEIADLSVQTIGGFDGLHIGHQYLLQQVKDIAKQRKAKSMVITFKNNPSCVLHPENPTGQLTTLEEKLSLLEAMDIDYVVLMDFTPQLSKMSARDFMREILIEKLKGAALLVGYDHRFGHQSSETFSDYQRYGEELNMDVILAGELPQEKSPIHVSSSVIRRAIAEGNMSLAKELLGRHYSISGTVTHGEGIGRMLGFPTANVKITDKCKILPKKAAYIVKVIIGEKNYPGMLYIGNRPTFDMLTEQRVEVHLVDFNEEIYGKSLKIDFLSLLREEQHFGSTEELKAQLERDLTQLRREIANA